VLREPEFERDRFAVEQELLRSLFEDRVGMDSYSGISPVSLRDWICDFDHENGNYVSDCIFCGQPFTGHKRRHCCHLCADLTVADQFDGTMLRKAIAAGVFS
jgi:hypothetical protein